MMLQGATAQTKGQRLFIGTANTARDGSGTGPGVFAAQFENGKLTQPEIIAKVNSPGFLAKAKGSDILFAQATAPNASDKHVSVAVAYRIGNGHHITEISRAFSQDGSGCHIGVSHDARAVFIANYGPGNVSSFLADGNGKLSEASFIQFPASDHGPDKERQEKAHAHSGVVSPDGDFVFVNDLGCDRIHVYKLDHATAKLEPHKPDHWAGTPGAGPRHLALHPNGKWVYNINEMGSSVDQLQWNATHGVLTTKGTWSTIPQGAPGKDQSRSCEMCFSKNFRFLYASNRIHESFAVFAIDPTTGALKLIQELPNPGRESRHMTIDATGKWLLSANQFSGDISVFPVDTETGKLGERTSMVQLAGPSCLLFA
jgi:6-phosphogluconolactonase